MKSINKPNNPTVIIVPTPRIRFSNPCNIGSFIERGLSRNVRADGGNEARAKAAKVSKIKVSLKWSNGKAIKGKKVTMKFRGNLYKAKTNSNGIATFKLPKKVIKNLKAGKTYKIRFTYLTNSIYKYIKIKK